MKSFVWFLLSIFCVNAVEVQAKSYVSRSYEDKYQRTGDERARVMMKRLNAQETDGKITLEDYKNLKLSRWEEKKARQDKKEGKYKTPEEQFLEMDENRDGWVDRDEMREFFAREAYRDYPSRKDRTDVSKYGEPLPEVSPEERELHLKAIESAVAEKNEYRKVDQDRALMSDDRKKKKQEIWQKYHSSDEKEASEEAKKLPQTQASQEETPATVPAPEVAEKVSVDAEKVSEEKLKSPDEGKISEEGDSPEKVVPTDLDNTPANPDVLNQVEI